MKPKTPSLRSKESFTDVSQESVKITSSDQLLTSAEVSGLIGKSQAWLARKRWEGGGIPYRKIGHHVRYQASVVMAWLNSQPLMTSTSAASNCN